MINDLNQKDIEIKQLKKALEDKHAQRTYAFAMENVARSWAARIAAELRLLKAYSNGTTASQLQDELLAARAKERDDFHVRNSLCARILLPSEVVYRYGLTSISIQTLEEVCSPLKERVHSPKLSHCVEVLVQHLTKAASASDYAVPSAVRVSSVKS